MSTCCRRYQWCRSCQRRFLVEVPACAVVTNPTRAVQAAAAAWAAGRRCSRCGGAETEVYNQRAHDPELWRRLEFKSRQSADNNATWKADNARARRLAQGSAPAVLRCLRCAERVDVLPAVTRPCPHCGGF